MALDYSIKSDKIVFSDGFEINKKDILYAAGEVANIAIINGYQIEVLLVMEDNDGAFSYNSDEYRFARGLEEGLEPRLAVSAESIDKYYSVSLSFKEAEDFIMLSSLPKVGWLFRDREFEINDGELEITNDIKVQICDLLIEQDISDIGEAYLNGDTNPIYSLLSGETKNYREMSVSELCDRYKETFGQSVGEAVNAGVITKGNEIEINPAVEAMSGAELRAAADEIAARGDRNAARAVGLSR